MIQNSYKKNNNGKLYLIPTPIGNLEDITLRAINVLKDSCYIFAEDTRVSKLLLSKLDIKNKKIFSCHKYSEEKNKDKIFEIIKTGNDVVYMSDRGTPLISDPGEVITNYLIDNNVNVIALPGPSALLPAINMSGLDNSKFLFYGFLNSKNSIKCNELKKICSIPYTIIFYESPHRIIDTLKCIEKILGNRKMSISREISKIYEEVFRGKVSDAIDYYKDPKGEFVFIIDGNKNTDDEVDYVSKVSELIDRGYKMSNAIKEIATLYGISKNELYNECKEKLLWN